jgi:hypothetical protein
MQFEWTEWPDEKRWMLRGIRVGLYTFLAMVIAGTMYPGIWSSSIDFMIIAFFSLELGRLTASLSTLAQWREVLGRTNVPMAQEQYGVELTIRNKAIEKVDRGIITLSGDYLRFRGLRTSFVLTPGDIRRINHASGTFQRGFEMQLTNCSVLIKPRWKIQMGDRRKDQTALEAAVRNWKTGPSIGGMPLEFALTSASPGTAERPAADSR